jgi:DNA-binding NarL/FixJ family response regulator
LSTRLRVLLADDYPGIVHAITRLLALDCDVVGSVADGSALVEAAQRYQPDVIVLDLNLPNVDGLEACRHITTLHPAIRVIMFTVESDPVVRQLALDAGASAFVSKLAVNDLLLAIKGLSEQLDVARG